MLRAIALLVLVGYSATALRLHEKPPKEVLRTLLANILPAFRQEKVNAVAFYGTVLGLQRDGDIAEGDDDVDFVVTPAEMRGAFATLVKLVKEQEHDSKELWLCKGSYNYETMQGTCGTKNNVHWTKNNMLWTKNNISSAAWPCKDVEKCDITFMKLATKNIKRDGMIDIYRVSPSRDGGTCLDFEDAWFNTSFLFPAKNLHLGKVMADMGVDEVPVPGQTDEYLAEHYGADWRTPGSSKGGRTSCAPSHPK